MECEGTEPRLNCTLDEGVKSNMRKRHAGVGRSCFARRQWSQCYLGCPTEPGGSECVYCADEQTGGPQQAEEDFDFQKTQRGRSNFKSFILYMLF